MLQRFITIFITGPVVIWMLWFNMSPYGTLPTFLLVVLLANVSLGEIYHMIASTYKKPLVIVGFVSILVILLSAFFSETSFIFKLPVIALIPAALIIFSLYELAKRKIYYLDNPFVSTLRGILYVSLLSYVILLRNLPRGGSFIFFLVFAVWAGDSAAYLYGRKFGKHRLNEEISPKKSVEGAVAGFGATVLASFILAATYIGWMHAFFLGLLIAIFEQLGDLYESLLKRRCNVKDSGNILPGHGGILDRLDSFLLLAPIFYYYLVFFGLSKMS